MTVKLSAALPKEFDANGMERLHRDLVTHPEDRHLIVMVVDTARKVIDYAAGGEVTPVAGVLFIEPIRDADDVAVVLDIMQRVQAERTPIQPCVGEDAARVRHAIAQHATSVAERLEFESMLGVLA